MVSTIGYERASLGDFIATLKLANIEILVDIRDRAQSRRPGFSKSALGSALESEGIKYLHMRELGDPKEGREAARAGNYARFRSIFDQVMQTDQAGLAVAKLESLASEFEICLMCFERDQTTCHRKIVADRLEMALDRKARHLGVKDGAGEQSALRRVRDTHQSSTASV
jgi:uncharacterized protein (DUF488 family)